MLLTCLSVVSDSDSDFLFGCILFIFILTDYNSKGGRERGVRERDERERGVRER